MRNLIALLLVLLSVILCSGCGSIEKHAGNLAPLCIEKISSNIGEYEHIPYLTGKGGINAEGEHVIQKNNLFYIIKKDGSDYFFSVKDKSDIQTEVPIFDHTESPPENCNEYINIIQRKTRVLIVEVKQENQEPSKIEVSCFINRDPNYLKRSGYILLTPLAGVVDIATVGVVTGGVAALVPLLIFGVLPFDALDL